MSRVRFRVQKQRAMRRDCGVGKFGPAVVVVVLAAACSGEAPGDTDGLPSQAQDAKLAGDDVEASAEDIAASADLGETGQTCTMPTVFSANTNKISKIEIPSNADGACDLSGDGEPDNPLGKALSTFASQIKSGIEDSIKSGELTILLEPTTWKADGSEFDVRVLAGQLASSQAGIGGVPTCDTTQDEWKGDVKHPNPNQETAKGIALKGYDLLPNT